MAQTQQRGQAAGIVERELATRDEYIRRCEALLNAHNIPHPDWPGRNPPEFNNQ